MDPAFAHHRLAASLAGQPIGHTVSYHEEIASTNDAARALAEAGHPHGVVVVADHQTAGRGRRGAEWFSPPRKNLLLSVLLRPTAPPQDWPRLTHLAALAVCEGIEAVLPQLQPQVKWPNDIFLSGRKSAGLLLESTFPAQAPPFSVLGLGLNVNLTGRDLPPELRPITTSLAIETGESFVAREPVAAAIIRALNRLLTQPAGEFPARLNDLRRRSLLLGRRVRAGVASQELTGTAEDLGPAGELVLIHDDGTRTHLNAVDYVRLTD
jgi:BirA family biotin operon repressor/biotin-[acetyl-CoA-carboxylase] ligase